MITSVQIWPFGEDIPHSPFKEQVCIHKVTTSYSYKQIQSHPDGLCRKPWCHFRFTLCPWRKPTNFYRVNLIKHRDSVSTLKYHTSIFKLIKIELDGKIQMIIKGTKSKRFQRLIFFIWGMAVYISDL